jgi:hypothetical protein
VRTFFSCNGGFAPALDRSMKMENRGEYPRQTFNERFSLRVVLVRERLDDVDENGRTYTHAVRGETGVIVGGYNDAAGPTVTWDRTGTTCDVAQGEYIMLKKVAC